MLLLLSAQFEAPPHRMARDYLHKDKPPNCRYSRHYDYQSCPEGIITSGKEAILTVMDVLILRQF